MLRYFPSMNLLTSQVYEICTRQKIIDLLPKSVREHILMNIDDETEPNKKEQEKLAISKVHTALIGSARTSALAVESYLQSKGYATSFWTSSMDGT